MLFDSIDFIVFLPTLFFLYWFVFNKHLQLQNLLIVVASAVFYGWWSMQFLCLIFFSIMVDFSVGRGLAKTEDPRKRKWLLWSSLFFNIGLLMYFKYCNFFIDNFIEAFSFFGTELGSNSLNIILPVGISFYTFQTLSYTIDVYNKKLPPTNDFIRFAAFVSFFPQLVAGPIEKASHLLPQFSIERKFDYANAVDGARQILWGFFKKIVIADNCARYANMVFDNSEMCNGSTLLLGVVFFSFQIYSDFSGYSDIAIGTARLFGFRLSKNFAFPFFSRNMAEFWQRWHISLSSWFRDYLYIPLGGSREGTAKSIRNIFIIFLVSGFWHGASWNYIVWGAIHALYFLPIFLSNKSRNFKTIVAHNRLFPSFKEFFQILLTFNLSALAFIFFRSETIEQAVGFVSGIFDASLFTMPYLTDDKPGYHFSLVLISFIVLEWLGREGKFALDKWIEYLFKPFRYLVYLILVLLIFYFSGTPQQFLYFQF
jgi:D-alanyl-lipoteichoic acid acyltransferase DltB (MBOAT superfamily)